MIIATQHHSLILGFSVTIPILPPGVTYIGVGLCKHNRHVLHAQTIHQLLDQISKALVQSVMSCPPPKRMSGILVLTQATKHRPQEHCMTPSIYLPDPVESRLNAQTIFSPTSPPPHSTHPYRIALSTSEIYPF